MRAPDGFSNTFTAAGSTSAFPLNGGQYALAAHAASWNGGSLDLQMLLHDGTWVTMTPMYGDSHLGADGSIYYGCPMGQYRLTLTTTAAATVDLYRVPGE